MDNYLLLKFIHLLGVVVFLGNIIVTALWKILADRTRSPAIVAYAQRLVTLTDITFTSVGAIMLVVTGNLMATKFGGATQTSWLVWGWGLFITSGLVWVFILIPLQIKQAKLAKVFSTADKVPDEYWALSKYWIIVGLIATILPLASLYLMVFKPA